MRGRSLPSSSVSGVCIRILSVIQGVSVSNRDALCLSEEKEKKESNDEHLLHNADRLKALQAVSKFQCQRTAITKNGIIKQKFKESLAVNE